jgi:NDP-sugar pyrophosphorylase family protein
MQAVILAGGKGTRLEDLTVYNQKSMLLIRGKPFLHYQIELFKRYNIVDFIICVYFQFQQVVDYFGDGSKFGVRIQYRYNCDLESGGALRSAEDLLDDFFFVINGDTYLPLNFSHMWKHATRCFDGDSDVVISIYPDYTTGNIIYKAGMVYYNYKIPHIFANHIDSGVYVIRKEALLSLIPANTFYRLPTFFHQLSEENRVSGYVAQKYHEIGSVDGLNNFKKYIGSYYDRNKNSV